MSIKIRYSASMTLMYALGSSSSGFGGNKTVILDEGMTSVPAITPVPTGFIDCENVSWAKDSILRLNKMGIINGKNANTFAPNDNTKREEFVKMLLLSSGIEPDAGATTNFGDVPSDSWYAPYVAKAVSLGIVTGVSDTEFGIGKEITRQDMAVLCYRMLAYLNKSVQTSDVYEFADESSISDYALESVKAMQGLGVIKGMDNNRFEPRALATRAQVAVVIDRLMNLK